MNKWDGDCFIEDLQLSCEKSVLEIGVGTGRLAVRVAPNCGRFVGIDVSPKTIERARENLAEYKNVELICDDFLTHEFDGGFDAGGFDGGFDDGGFDGGGDDGGGDE